MPKDLQFAMHNGTCFETCDPKVYLDLGGPLGELAHSCELARAANVDYISLPKGDKILVFQVMRI